MPVLALALAPIPAQALDTWETYDPRSGGVDVGLGGGLALGSADVGPAIESSAGGWVVGYVGLEPFTVYGWTEMTGYGDATELGGGAGLFGNPVDTGAFDLDLGFQLYLFDGSFAPYPWVEFNLDFKPDMELAGLFVRAELAPWITPGAPPELAMELYLVAGGYIAIDDDQLLLGSRGLADLSAEPSLAHALVAGWNPGIGDWGELVTEVEVGLPEAKGEPVAVSASLQLSVWFGGE